MKTPIIIGITPFEQPDVNLACAMSNAKAFPVLHLGRDKTVAADALEQLSNKCSKGFGVCLISDDLKDVIFPEQVTMVILPYGIQFARKKQVKLFYREQVSDLTICKEARKEVYVTTANLASLFQRMFSEPKSKQIMMKELHQFTALNHLLSSYVATLSLYNKDHSFVFSNFEELNPITQNTVYLLNLASENLFKNTGVVNNVPLIRRNMNVNDDEQSHEVIIAEQFDMIQKVAYDIYKLSEKIKL